jgi:hypothetical protein
LEVNTAMDLFGISLRTYNRIKEDKENTLIETKYTVGVS